MVGICCEVLNFVSLILKFIECHAFEILAVWFISLLDVMSSSIFSIFMFADISMSIWYFRLKLWMTS